MQERYSGRRRAMARSIALPSVEQRKHRTLVATHELPECGIMTLLCPRYNLLIAGGAQVVRPIFRAYGSPPPPLSDVCARSVHSDRPAIRFPQSSTQSQRGPVVAPHRRRAARLGNETRRYVPRPLRRHPGPRRGAGAPRRLPRPGDRRRFRRPDADAREEQSSPHRAGRRRCAGAAVPRGAVRRRAGGIWRTQPRRPRWRAARGGPGPEAGGAVRHSRVRHAPLCAVARRVSLLLPAHSPRHPVAVNLFGSERRMSLALGVDCLDQVGARIAELLALKIPEGLLGKLALLPRLAEVAKFPPKTVGRASCQDTVLKDSDIDLTQFPAPICWPEDGGPYITLGGVIT